MVIETKLIKAAVEQAFNEVYEPQAEYQLVKVAEMERIGHVSYVLIEGTLGVLCEFSVSDPGIYAASSKADLLSSPYQVKDWLMFMSTIKELLDQVRNLGEEENEND